MPHTGADAGYTSLLSVVNASMNPYGLVEAHTAHCNVDAYFQGKHYGPASLPVGAGASFPAGSLPPATEETLTGAQIQTATGLLLANSGQRATLYITCDLAGVTAQMLFVNPGGVVSFVPGIAASTSPMAAAITYPAPNSLLSGSAVNFQWSPGAGGSRLYKLFVSALAPGSSEIYNSGTISATQANVTGIPTTGGPVYVRLYYEVNKLWMHTDYTFTQY